MRLWHEAPKFSHPALPEQTPEEMQPESHTTKEGTTSNKIFVVMAVLVVGAAMMVFAPGRHQASTEMQILRYGPGEVRSQPDVR